jgi:hypothetical protein
MSHTSVAGIGLKTYQTRCQLACLTTLRASPFTHFVGTRFTRHGDVFLCELHVVFAAEICMSALSCGEPPVDPC